MLRVQDRQLELLAEQGLARSATLRALVTELERGHVIVFVVVARDLAAGVAGRLRFIGAGDGWRLLRIDLDDRWPRIDLVAKLGHELQHAAEIANSPDVVDAQSMAALYDRIGLNRVAGPAAGFRDDYETQAARDTERRVYLELMVGGWG